MSSAKEKLVNYMRTRGIGYFLIILAIIFAVVSIILYQQNGINIYSNTYNSAVFISLGIGIGLSVVSMFVDVIPVKWSKELVTPIRAAAYLLFLYAILQYIKTQVTFLGAVVVAIDVEQYGPLIPGFAATFSIMIIAAVIAVIATCLSFCVPGIRLRTYTKRKTGKR